jgi:ribosomal protein S18 acetylase RimI-like enzyme
VVEIETLAPSALEEVRPLLVELLAEDHGLLGEIRPGFAGENVILVVREEGEVVALCWCAIWDPGTGPEGEVAEVYVRPGHRGRGLARQLLSAAVRLFTEREVTFATVWTTTDNDAALRLYRGAGFTPTDQAVLTWLPGRGA